MADNIVRLAERAESLGVSLRPHLKTKSIEVARCVTGGQPGPITVSKLGEAEVFREAGYDDILYAVGISPQNLERVRALRIRGCDLAAILDSEAKAQAVARVGFRR